MLWKKRDNIYINFCAEDEELQIFEHASMMGHHIPPSKSNRQSLMVRKQGNFLFQRKKWGNAMEAYNRSLCLAENGSEHVSLAFANRSACFLHLKMYNRCLIDIELAKQENYPERLMPKLDDRKALCLELIEANGQTANFEPSLSFQPDVNFPCMANVLQLQRNEEFGRHIISNADIEVGQTILTEKAFITSIRIDKYKRCDTCSKRNVNLIPCTHCTSVLFCEGPCSENNYHDVECNMQTTDEEYVNDQQMQTVRSILIAINEFPNTDDLMKFVEEAIKADPRELPNSEADSKYRAFLKLSYDRNMVAKETFPTQTLFIYKTLLNHRAVKPKFLTTKHRRFLMHLIGHHLCIIQCNTGGLVYNSESPFNVAQVISENLSILGNFINHSCAPNLTIVSFNDLNVYVTIRPIKKGDQLFLSYFRNDPMNHNTENRQEYLQNICDFICKCERCVTPAEPVEVKDIKSDECYREVRKYGQKMACEMRNSGLRVLNLCSCCRNGDNDSKMLMDKSIECLSKFGQIWSPELEYVVKCYIFTLERNVFKQ